MQQQPPPSQSQYRPAGGQHHHGHHISMPPTVSVATGAVINPAQANPNAASAQQPQQQQPKVVMYFQPQDPSSVSVSAATGQVFVHQPNFVVLNIDYGPRFPQLTVFFLLFSIHNINPAWRFIHRLLCIRPV